jgi:hypothetical protein
MATIWDFSFVSDEGDGRVVEFNGAHYWHSWEGFASDYAADNSPKEPSAVFKSALLIMLDEHRSALLRGMNDYGESTEIVADSLDDGRDSGAISAEPYSGDTREQAMRLAHETKLCISNCMGVYLFPEDNEIRMVVLDPTWEKSESGGVEPYYFSGDVLGRCPTFPSVVAHIRPEEFGRLVLPDGWVGWEDAVLAGGHW